ncbi:MAG: nitroreductase family protein [Acidobacteria bacterium]|nr:nitroreductase family protein [Acidobacteriota bacterium]
MNPVLDAIRNRRSVRAYEPRPVARALLMTIIDAANRAPSGMNTQPWRFVVVEDPELKNKLVQTAVPNSKRYLEPLRETNPARHAVIMKRYEELEDPVYYSAPAIVFVIGKGAYAADSCPLACQNMMLAAQSLGLGTCWVKLGSLILDNDELVRALELKQGETIFGPILVGYPKQIPEPPVKKDPVIKWI